MFIFTRKKNLTKYNDYFILWATNKGEVDISLGVTLIKAHKSKPCIPVFPTKEMANIFTKNSPFNYEVIPLSRINTLAYPSDYNTENSLLIEMNQTLVEDYIAGKITSLKYWRNQLR